MPHRRLKDGVRLVLTYRVPKNGIVGFDIVSDEPVTTYVLDVDGLAEMKAGEARISSYGGFRKKRRHRQELRLPFDGDWFLVIENTTGFGDTDVEYEVWF